MMPLALLLMPLLLVVMARHEPWQVVIGLTFCGAWAWVFAAYLGFV
jgi:RsiW-degrading membrane proteinase PrsW (M82 family)